MRVGAKRDVEALRSEIDQLRIEVACLRAELAARQPYAIGTTPLYWWQTQPTCVSNTSGKVA